MSVELTISYSTRIRLPSACNIIVLLRLNFKPEVTEIRQATTFLDAQVREMGPMSRPERRLAGLGLVTIAAWIIFGGRAAGGLDLAVIGLIAAVMIFVLRIADWQRRVA